MKKILFLIRDLGQGGAEKVLINLVNNMDSSKFDISVITLFKGINADKLNTNIHYSNVFNISLPGNSHIMKLISPKILHKICVKEEYDVEVAYLEGPSARVISGCTNPKTKLVSWIHCNMNNKNEISNSFRNFEESKSCYNKFNNVIFVSKTSKESFNKILKLNKSEVLYNTVDSTKIISDSKKKVNEINTKCFNLISVGTLKQIKGFDRLIKIIKRLVDNNYKICLHLLGDGPDKEKLVNLVKEYELNDHVKFLGYQTNPYKYVANCNLFVCSSYSEGFSTAATEALIVGTPVCTVEVSGMKEMLGKNNEYGVVVDNDDEALYSAIKELLDNPQLLAHYKEKANERGKYFSKEKTVKAVEEMLLNL